MSPDTLFWGLLAFSLLIPVGIYKQEKQRYGGMGLASPCAVSVIIYALVNPAAYVINPLLAIKYAEYVGLDQTPETLLPAVISTVTFLVAWYIGLVLRRRYKITREQKKLTPLSPEAYQRLLKLGVGLLLFGFFMYVVRNQLVYGSPFASVNKEYAGDEARPQIAFWSSCGMFIVMGTLTLSALSWWQLSSGRWPLWMAIVPVLIGVGYAIAEGDRQPSVTAVLFAVGWLGFRAHIKLKHLVGALFLVTFLTLLANARYFKGEHGFTERLTDIVDPEHFRPFWSSDPSGPSTVATLESQRVINGGEVSWGMGYVDSVLSIVPRFIWPDRPDDPSIQFSKWYANYAGHEYSPGTGYAYSMYVEAFVNFSYLGSIILGLVLAGLVDTVTLWCVRHPGGLSRIVFACVMAVLPLQLNRAFLLSLVSPTAVINYTLIWYICNLVSGRFTRKPLELPTSGGTGNPIPNT